MIVELIGPTGSGKSTLTRRLAAHLAGVDGAGATTEDDLVTNRPILRRVSNEQAINLLQDVRGLPWFVRSLRDHAEVLRLSAEIIRTHAPTRFDQAMDVRSVMRRIGMYELARRQAAGRVVLLDEGPVLIAYHLFVNSTAQPTDAALARFAATVPLPDRIIYVRSPLPVLLQRASTRPDRRRQVSGLPPEKAQAPLRRALDVFDRLVSVPRLSERTVVVDNDSADLAELDRLAAHLARTLRPMDVGGAQQARPVVRTVVP